MTDFEILNILLLGLQDHTMYCDEDHSLKTGRHFLTLYDTEENHVVGFYFNSDGSFDHVNFREGFEDE